jgi:membrane protein involved in colicin uptake
MVKQSEKPKDEKPAKVQNDCGCGCKGKTFRRFLPGHDAKLKSQLLNTAVDPKATPAQVRTAEKQLTDLGWGDFLTKRQAKVAADAEKAEKRAKAKAERDEAKKVAAEKKKADAAAKKEADAKAKAAAEAAAKE